MGLPIVDGGATCFGCLAPCCTSYAVPLTGFDLWRLVRGLQLPWQEVAELRAQPEEGFAVDESRTRLGLFLPRRHGEVCRFLFWLPNHEARCGAHGSRPLACRVYPWVPDQSRGAGLKLAERALCPPPKRAHFDAQKAQAREPVAAELSELPLHAFVLERWNEEVAGRRPASTERLMAWLLALHDALWPLRESAGWAHAARRRISEFPLP